MKTLEFKPCAGTRIEHACIEAVKMAVDHNADVKFDFNGIEIEVTPQSSPRVAEDQWHAKLEASRRDYELSPEGIAAADRRKSDVIQKQASVNLSLLKLPDVLNDLDGLMKWLKFFTHVADHVGVTFSRDQLIAQLEGAGFKENEHVGQKPEFFSNRERMGRYIVGQALNCLRMGMGPHPVTASFVDKYFEIPA